MYVWWQIQYYFTCFLDIALLVEEIRQPIVGLWQISSHTIISSGPPLG